MSSIAIVIIGITVILVHVLKALRLYIIMFGEKIDKKRFFQTYFETAIINLIIPFKAGELYRGFRYGRIIESIPMGYTLILWDRFVDTLALVSIFLLVNFLLGYETTPILIFFVVFLVAVILLYIAIKPFYYYWNSYLMINRTSKRTLKVLSALESMKKGYELMSQSIKGRFGLLFVLSLAAWGIEIATLFLVGPSVVVLEPNDYFISMLFGGQNEYNQMFTLLAVIVNAIGFAVMVVWKRGTDRCVR